jgi:hypothetical protein
MLTTYAYIFSIPYYRIFSDSDLLYKKVLDSFRFGSSTLLKTSLKYLLYETKLFEYQQNKTKLDEILGNDTKLDEM